MIRLAQGAADADDQRAHEGAGSPFSSVPAGRALQYAAGIARSLRRIVRTPPRRRRRGTRRLRPFRIRLRARRGVIRWAPRARRASASVVAAASPTSSPARGCSSPRLVPQDEARPGRPRSGARRRRQPRPVDVSFFGTPRAEPVPATRIHPLHGADAAARREMVHAPRAGGRRRCQGVGAPAVSCGRPGRALRRVEPEARAVPRERRSTCRRPPSAPPRGTTVGDQDPEPLEDALRARA